MCVFLISPVPIAEPLTSELIDTPVFYNLAPRPIKYRVSVPIPNEMYHQNEFFGSLIQQTGNHRGGDDFGSAAKIIPPYIKCFFNI